MTKRTYYTVVATVYVERIEKYQKMAGYVPALDEEHAYKVAKAYCMDRYNCPMHKVYIEALCPAKDQELATSIPVAIDTRSYDELVSGDGLFSVERDLLNFNT
ncbi:hypothetical protein HPT25_26370 [Bacillus sp. BRMEA1]|uniref:hypothetical protein n=1 Tax=Neobacillus endophyticus TaxID=2738405 RepID=UPI001564869B|nr:hypothetical protein [Neobacillus endophyticus]NRD80857.1 hypothetical protein [Neobacillus endophyticus]